MASRQLGFADRRDWPALGALVPGLAARAVLAALGASLTFVGYRQPLPIVLGLLLTAAAAVAPRSLTAWVLIVFLGLGQLTHHAAALDWRLLVLLAGLHLLHVVAAQTLELPVRSWLQLATLRAPLRRFVAIQVPTQVIAVVTLLTLAPRDDGSRRVSIAALSTVGAVAFVALTWLLVVPFLRDKQR